jgi:hypothetical protein
MVVMPIIPASLEVIRRITVQGHLGQKARETPSQPTNGMWWCALVIPAIREVVGRRVTVWATWANTWDPTWKTTKTIKDCEAWLKWQSACLARARPRVQIQNKEGREGEKKQSWGSLIKVPNKVCGQSIHFCLRHDEDWVHRKAVGWLEHFPWCLFSSSASPSTKHSGAGSTAEVSQETLDPDLDLV